MLRGATRARSKVHHSSSSLRDAPWVFAFHVPTAALTRMSPATASHRPVRRESVLHLVDLAGSERLSASGSGEDPKLLKEAQAINSSLSALGNTIAALATKQQHVPYRNSKLTYLLQNALGGNCKSLMCVCVAPSASNAAESLCSLRFAKKTGSCAQPTATRC